MYRPSRCAALLLALLLPATALAEPKDDARRYFLAGLEAAKAGAYEEALEDFLEAQGLYPHPATAFNIARAYEDLGDIDNAITWYQTFQEMSPDQADRASARIDALKALRVPVAAPTAAAVGTTATSEQLERLKAVAAELESLAADLAAQPASAPVPAEASPSSAEAAPAAAAHEDFFTEAYDRVVVSASRQNQDPLDSPSTITVLTSDDIRLSGATNIPDLLRRVPGVEVMSLANGSAQVAIRGFNSELSNKVLWLIDGRSIYLDFLASPLPSNIPVGLDQIERIEIIRGPGSAVYGANAMTGVINIITRPPGEGDDAFFEFDFGYPDLLQASANTSGSTGPVAYRFGAGYQQQGRWAKEFEGDVPASLDPFFDNQDRAFQKLRADGRIDYTFLDQGYASVSGGYTAGELEFYNLGALGDYGLDYETGYMRADVVYGPGHARVFWNHDDMTTGPWFQATDAPRDLRGDAVNDTVDVELEGNFEFTTGTVRHRLNVGGGYRYKRTAFSYLAGGFDNPWVENHWKLFVQEQVTWEWLSAVVSFRMDKHPLLPLQETLSPRGALIFRVTPTTAVRVAAGTAYRGMSFVESYMDLNLNAAADAFYVRDYGGFVNPDVHVDLRPERVLNLEAGVHDESSLYHVADATIFWNRVTDLIGLAPLTPGLAPFDPGGNGYEAGTTGWDNQSDLTYDAIGAELDAKVFPVDGLDVFTNLSLLRILESTPDATSKDESSSLVKFNAGVMYRAPFRMDFSLAGTFYSKQVWRLREFDATGNIVTVASEIPSRFILSARVAGRPIPDNPLELAITLWNPLGFSNGFQEHPKGQPVGARLFGSVSYAF